MVKNLHVKLVVRLSPLGGVWQPLWSSQAPPRHAPPSAARVIKDEHVKGYCLSKGKTVKIAVTDDKGSALCALPKPGRFLGPQLV